tara:strand:- start:4862 stop:6340 length:1479 start_codon:yes stop_codon:yes gene_type:complete
LIEIGGQFEDAGVSGLIHATCVINETCLFDSGFFIRNGIADEKKGDSRARIGNPKESECKKPKNPFWEFRGFHGVGLREESFVGQRRELVRFPVAYPRKVLKDKFMNPNHSLAILILTLFQAHFLFGQSLKSLKVFVLAGQSNMEGKGAVDPLLNHQIKAPETRKLFAHLHSDGKYLERGDVWIDYLGRRGNLTVGYGSPGKIGPELEFGHTMGDRFSEQVLIIKTAWGGKSLGRDFRPPSSGLPKEEKIMEFVEGMAKREFNNLLKREWNLRKKKDPGISKEEVEKSMPESVESIFLENKKKFRQEVVASHGHYYRLMMEEIGNSLQELQVRFPTYQGRGYELSGFVWFQGWNDMYNGFQDEYAENMKNFIKDVRKDLGEPDLPFVIGIMGQNGFKEAKGNMAIVKAAQSSMNEVPEFAGTVRAIPTDVHWDRKADEAYPSWRKNFEEWKKIGSDHPYHYLGSTLFFSRVGRAFGQTLLDLMKEPTSKDDE